MLEVHSGACKDKDVGHRGRGEHRVEGGGAQGEGRGWEEKELDYAIQYVRLIRNV